MKMFSSPALDVQVEKTHARLTRLHDSHDARRVQGEFFFLIHITAKEQDLYLPLSVASGKKPAGFVYQIEGTAGGDIVTTDISCRGTGVTQVTFGTLLYAKIPVGKVATVRILVETKGEIGKKYSIAITQISYKHAPSDARYQKFSTDIRTPLSRSL